ncbi:MAG: FAD-dependent oxidoreductase [Candidatus Nephthysia bennettiae]|uniref:FAD-dependent oxidoreductase n=1 Tax=Candidatus Nephthysia bennettiae TaxID=3127016 RepID=A0A934N4V9_9BACT|nr:FAD-dependent oxidoreductase [Candidatus Dormibacteraeota bacterium]PZR88012.1 MAG: FAD-dependent oxidoreductase [Candidatus Dormibacteraeota bacterium]
MAQRSEQEEQEEKLDAIVVGAGPAGTSAAITMARAGLQVALVEKGSQPGSKNVMGGILYTHNLREVVGDDGKSAALERPIIEEQRWLMTDEAAIRLLGYKNLRNREHPHSYSVLRARFDAWFAQKAEEAGAFLIPETVVEELILRDGRVVGVRTGREGDLLADVVVVCEGIGLGSHLLEKAGLKKPLKANQVAMAVKEIIALDPALIESRFNCEPGEGASIECFGSATRGLSGFMFIYTNKDTLSVGGGALLSEMSDIRLSREELARRTPNALMNHFKNHPAIKPLIQGGETVEYLAKMIPEGGYKAIPKLYGAGYLIAGDAAMLSNPVHREGSNLAMESGRLAGETVIHAKEKGDFGESSLREYRLRLDRSWVMADMKKYDGAVPLLEHNPQMLSKYPQLLDRALDEFFRVDGVSKWDKQRRIMRMFRKEGGPRMLMDSARGFLTLYRPFGR